MYAVNLAVDMQLVALDESAGGVVDAQDENSALSGTGALVKIADSELLKRSGGASGSLICQIDSGAVQR